jgi:hypothetical protein
LRPEKRKETRLPERVDVSAVSHGPGPYRQYADFGKK